MLCNECCTGYWLAGFAGSVNEQSFTPQHKETTNSMNYTTTKAQRFLTALAAALIVGFAGVSCSDAETDIQKVIPELLANMVPIPGKDFKLGKYEVTQLQWRYVMCNAPSLFDGVDKPVVNVSWYDCHEFLKKLNDMPEVKASGLVFRLPTEAEWEYACRAGATGEYCKLADGTEITKNTLDDVAWFDDNSGGKTHPVGQKKPNAFGLYDMHGNVWEWCEDLYRAGYSYRVRRGGSWNLGDASSCAAGYRGNDNPGGSFSYLGFRLAASQDVNR